MIRDSYIKEEMAYDYVKEELKNSIEKIKTELLKEEKTKDNNDHSRIH